MTIPSLGVARAKEGKSLRIKSIYFAGTYKSGFPTAKRGRKGERTWIEEKEDSSWGTWVAQSVKWPTLDFGSGHDLLVSGFGPGFGLCADSLEPGVCFGFCVSLFLPFLHSHSVSLSLSLSLKNKH